MFLQTLSSVRQVQLLGEAYGGLPFWEEVLRGDTYSENIWHALMYLGCLKNHGFEPLIRDKLHHPDSWVRAWACFALAALEDNRSAQQIAHLRNDPSHRVRVHARLAMESITGVGQTSRKPTYNRAHREDLIIVSDDSDAIQIQLTNKLTSKGYLVTSATTEEETITFTQDLAPAAIITDNQKGGDNTNGLRMTTSLSRKDDLKEVVLLMFSADEVEGAFLWSGGDGFVHKHSGGIDQLITVVHSYLQEVSQGNKGF